MASFAAIISVDKTMQNRAISLDKMRSEEEIAAPRSDLFVSLSSSKSFFHISGGSLIIHRQYSK